MFVLYRRCDLMDFPSLSEKFSSSPDSASFGSIAVEKFFAAALERMQALRYVYELACEATHYALPACGCAEHEVEEVGVWWVPFKREVDCLVQAATKKKEILVGCFVFSVAVALLGLIESVNDFVFVCGDKTNVPRTISNRKYQQIPRGVQRLCRLFGSILGCVVNLVLLLSLIKPQSYSNMAWIIINGIALVLETSAWIINSAATRILSLRPLASITLLAIRFAVIVAVTTVVAKVMRH